MALKHGQNGWAQQSVSWGMCCQRDVCAASQKIKGLTHLVCIAVLDVRKKKKEQQKKGGHSVYKGTCLFLDFSREVLATSAYFAHQPVGGTCRWHCCGRGPAGTMSGTSIRPKSWHCTLDRSWCHPEHGKNWGVGSWWKDHTLLA